MPRVETSCRPCRVDRGYVSVPSITRTGKGGTRQEECPAGSKADKDICRPCEGNTWAPKGSTECAQCDTADKPCAYSSKDKGLCLPQGKLIKPCRLVTRPLGGGVRDRGGCRGTGLTWTSHILTPSSIALSGLLRIQAPVTCIPVGERYTKLVTLVHARLHAKFESGGAVARQFGCSCCHMSAVVAAAAAVRISRKNDTGVSCSLNGLIKSNRSEPVLECGTPLPDLRETVSRVQQMRAYTLNIHPGLPGKLNLWLHPAERTLACAAHPDHEHLCCTLPWLRQRTRHTASRTQQVAGIGLLATSMLSIQGPAQANSVPLPTMNTIDRSLKPEHLHVTSQCIQSVTVAGPRI
jgi:hypothetical protein